jgi:hypothetical protein
MSPFCSWHAGNNRSTCCGAARPELYVAKGSGDPHYAGRARCRNGETCPHSRRPGRRIRCRRIFRTGGGESGRGLRQIIQLRESGRIAGLLHDLGKYSEACQYYIASAGVARGPDHSTAGAREVLKVAS